MTTKRSQRATTRRSSAAATAGDTATEPTPIALLVDDDDVPKRFKGGAWPVFKVANDYISPVVQVLAVVGALAAVAEYSQRLQAARVEESLRQVEVWDSGEFRQRYLEVNDLLWPLYRKQAEYLRTLPDNQRAIFYGNMGEAITGRDDWFNGDVDKSVDRVFYFFDRAALCADQRICDYDVLNTFLGNDLRDFWRYFHAYAERRRFAGYVDYGVWTENFANGRIARASIL